MSTNSCNKESDVHATSSHSTPSNQRRIIKAKRPPGMSVVLSDEDLFKQPPKKDCPICMLPLPALESGSMYNVYDMLWENCMRWMYACARVR